MSTDETCANCGKPLSEGTSHCPACTEEATQSLTCAPELGGPEVAGHRILRVLGQGGMGRVYLAEDTTLERRVAIKVITGQLAERDEAYRRFLREARAMAAVEHPHIVQVFAFGEVGGQPYIVMQYVDGQSLAHRLRHDGRLEPDGALTILEQVIDALAAAWSRSIVHRDLKPGNILLDGEGRVRVADFGLAKQLAVEGVGEVTLTGHMVGTPSYASPEQLRGEEVDLRSDIYSLGIVLYEMLTGERPFVGTTPVAVIDQHLHAPMPDLGVLRPDLPREYQELVDWMTAKAPGERPASYDALRERIAALRTGSAGAAPSAAGARPPMPSLDAIEEPEAAVFVAREAELERLESQIEQAMNGRGSVAFVTGEAGTGKTALVQELVRRAVDAHDELVVAVGSSSAHTGIGDAHAPWRQVLAQLSGDVETRVAGGMGRERARRLCELAPVLAEAVLESCRDLIDTLLPGAGLLKRAETTAAGAPWLISLRELVQRKASLPPDASLQQGAVFNQVMRLLGAAAKQRPLLLVLEDLHWADAGSVALLFHLGREVSGQRVLILGTYRPAEVALGRGGERHPLEPALAELQRIHGEVLIPLGQAGDRAFVDAIVDSEPNVLGEDFRSALFEQTQGHALFTVELLRAMQERGMLVEDPDQRWVEGANLDWSSLPARVEGVIGERIERLSEDLRDALTIAAVEGEDFTAEVVSRVSDSDTRGTIKLLSRELEKRHRLVSARGIRTLAAGRLSHYGFSHVLFQRYIYSSLDEVERAQLHQDVGEVLEALYGDSTDEIAPQLARHFDEAGITGKAITFLQLAGEQAVRRTANVEAIDHFRRALELLATLPESAERDGRELALQVAIFAPLMTTQGWGSDEVGRAADRALELAERLGDPEQLLPVLALAAVYYGNVDIPRATELGIRMLEVAKSRQDEVMTMVAHWVTGVFTAAGGRLAEGRNHLETALSMYDPEQHGWLMYVYGLDPGVACRLNLAWILQFQGYLDQGMEHLAQALELAETLDHPLSTAFAHDIAFGNYHNIYEYDAAAEQAHRQIEVAQENGLAALLASGKVRMGGLQVREGEVDQGIALMTAGLDELEQIGDRYLRGGNLYFAAVAYNETGRHDAAMSFFDEALATIARTGERSLEHEALIFRGKALRQAGCFADAEGSFQAGLEVARGHGARLFELQAATALARLWQTQGKRREARELLQPVYGWFTEGLDTAPMLEARALLDELG